MTNWARLHVSYCQYEVTTVPGVTGLGIHTIGDTLLQVGGPSRLTGFCGIHTGPIEARLRVLPEPPTRIDAGWDAISEATLWSPSGRLSVIGLMGGVAEALVDVAVPRGLIRVRVHARHRLPETVRTDDDPPEQHELHVWAAREEIPWRTCWPAPSVAAGSRNLRRPPSGRCCPLFPARPPGRRSCRRCRPTRTRTTRVSPGLPWCATGPHRSACRWACCPSVICRCAWNGSTQKVSGGHGRRPTHRSFPNR